MAKTMATVVAGMAMAAGSMAAPAVAAEPAEAMTVVLHVADYQHVPSRDLAKAQQVASAVYARIGVQLVWTTGAAPAEPDGALHADVVIMDRAMAQRDNRDSKVFGQASHHTRLAKVYASRVLDHAFATVAEKRDVALIVGNDPALFSMRDQIVSLASRYRVPAIYGLHEYVARGGLMFYGNSLSDAFRQAGVYTGRILKGEKPGDLPIAQATRFEFVINLRTAKDLGLEVSAKLLALADSVIE